MTLRPAVVWRVSCTLTAIVIVEATVCAVAASPVAIAWIWLAAMTSSSRALRVAAFSMALMPSYVAFAVTLMTASAAATRITRARTPRDAVLRIADMSWPLMRWARYMAATHVVRFFAGSLLRGSPIWSWYLRMNGARLGRRVYVNSLAINDHNLLTFGDDVVIGSNVHLSGHTVERGLLKTGAVRLGRGVVIGLGSVVGIDVDAGDGCQVGALSLVPKHSRLQAGCVYAGVPVQPLHPVERSAARRLRRA